MIDSVCRCMSVCPRVGMQAHVKPNQAFKDVAHRQYLTTNNIDELLTTLQQLKVNQDPTYKEPLFADSFIRTLPSIPSGTTITSGTHPTTHICLSHRSLSRPLGHVTDHASRPLTDHTSKPLGHVTRYSHRHTSLNRHTPLPPPLPPSLTLPPPPYPLLPCRPKPEGQFSEISRGIAISPPHKNTKRLVSSLSIPSTRYVTVYTMN